MKKARRNVRMVSPPAGEESSLGLQIPVHIIPHGARPFQGSKAVPRRPEKAQNLPAKAAPLNSHQQKLKQVVADYLHAPHRHGAPRGLVPAACPCCLDRNAENMLRMTHTADPRVQPLAPNAIPQPVLDPRTTIIDWSNLSPERVLPITGHQGSGVRLIDYWSPLHNGDVYPILAVNRVLSLQSREESSRKVYGDASRAYVSRHVQEADLNFNQAMKRLRRSVEEDFV